MPEIPRMRAPGQMAVELGAGVATLGNALTRIATGLQQGDEAARQQAGLDIGEYDQVATATRAANSWKNVLKANLSQDPEYDMARYEEDWQALSTDLIQKTTLPSAYTKVQEMLTKIRDETEEFAMSTFASRAVARDEALYLTGRDELTQAGDADALAEGVHYAFSKGIITEAEMTGDLEKYLPLARYNGVMNELEGIADPAMAIALIDAGRYDDRLGARKEDAIKQFQYVQETERKLQESVMESDGLKYYDDFMQKIATDGGFRSLDEAEAYVNLVDQGHRETVRGAVDRLRKQIDDAPAFAQDQRRDHLNSQVWDWAAAASPDTKEPFTEQEIEALATGDTPAVRAEQVQEIKDNLAQARLQRDDKEVSGMYSRLYTAMDENKNPGLVLSIAEIDSTVQDAGKHQAILSKRNELQREYETRSNTTREAVELDAYRVVYHPTMTTAAKKKWIDEHAGNGLSMDDATKWRGKVDPFNDDDNRKKAMGAIVDAYQTSMKNPNLSTSGVKKLELELYKAQQQMEGVFLANPDNTAAWNDQVTRILQDKVVNDINTLVRQVAGATVDKFATGDIRPAYREATAIEYLREQGQAPVGAATEEVTKKIKELESDALKAASLTKAKDFTATLSTGDVIYSDKKIVRGEGGKIVPSADLYQVRYQIKNGTYVPTVYRMNMTTYTFSDVVWEQGK